MTKTLTRTMCTMMNITMIMTTITIMRKQRQIQVWSLRRVFLWLIFHYQHSLVHELSKATCIRTCYLQPFPWGLEGTEETGSEKSSHCQRLKQTISMNQWPHLYGIRWWILRKWWWKLLLWWGRNGGLWWFGCCSHINRKRTSFKSWR